jgi:hypothetical protein
MILIWVRVANDLEVQGVSLLRFLQNARLTSLKGNRQVYAALYVFVLS